MSRSPLGRVSRPLRVSRVSGSRLRASRLKARLEGSKMRMTVFSPRIVGNVEMRSTTLPASGKVLARPSCGSCVSWPMRLAMTFRRPVILGRRSLGRWMSSLSTPLIRTRTAMLDSQGSMWMSLAPERTASMRTQSTSRTTSMSSSEGQAWRNRSVSLIQGVERSLREKPNAHPTIRPAQDGVRGQG